MRAWAVAQFETLRALHREGMGGHCGRSDCIPCAYEGAHRNTLPGGPTGVRNQPAFLYPYVGRHRT